MDRVIIYPAAIPLETDLLSSNLNAMVGLGRLAMDILGTSTLVSGLPCTQTAVASMQVAIGAGAIYSAQPIDSSAYSSLPANTTDQILKQGILLASANKELTLTAPTTPGTSVIYLIEAAFSEIDAKPVMLPYYNASNPTQPYSGPGGGGAAQNTVRQGQISLQAKAGIAASSPSAPAVDNGYVPLYLVTVAYGQTTIVNANISVAPSAPFIPGTLGGLAPIASPAFTGTPTAPTPASGDESNLLATTAFVKALLPGKVTKTGSATLPASGAASASVSVSFTTPFPNACDLVLAIPQGQVNSSGGGNPILVATWTAAGFTIAADSNTGQFAAGAGRLVFNQTVPVAWIAFGH